MGAFVGALHFGNRHVPPLPNDDWQAQAVDANVLAQGRFVLHGTPRAKRGAHMPWFIWFVLVLGVALYLGASWWRKQSELPHHDTGPLLILAVLLFICWGAVWRAWHLQRRIVPKAD